jgi:hypothetical protein
MLEKDYIVRRKWFTKKTLKQKKKRKIEEKNRGH